MTMTDEQVLAVLENVASFIRCQVADKLDAAKLDEARAHIAARLSEQGAGGGGVEVRNNPDGSLDEIVGQGLFHLEQMDTNRWWMSLGPHGVWLGAKGKITARVELNAYGPYSPRPTIAAPPAAAVEGEAWADSFFASIKAKPADSAGVTEAMVEAACFSMHDRSWQYLEADHRDELRDEMRAALEAALSAARGK